MYVQTVGSIHNLGNVLNSAFMLQPDLQLPVLHKVTKLCNSNLVVGTKVGLLKHQRISLFTIHMEHCETLTRNTDNSIIHCSVMSQWYGGQVSCVSSARYRKGVCQQRRCKSVITARGSAGWHAKQLVQRFFFITSRMNGNVVMTHFCELKHVLQSFCSASNWQMSVTSFIGAWTGKEKAPAKNPKKNFNLKMK